MNFPKSLPITGLNQKGPEQRKAGKDPPEVGIGLEKAINVPIYSLSLVRTSFYNF
jgi:hypothetical protein